jgi:hypothetical protein
MLVIFAYSTTQIWSFGHDRLRLITKTKPLSCEKFFSIEPAAIMLGIYRAKANIVPTNVTANENSKLAMSTACRNLTGIRLFVSGDLTNV